MSSQPAKNELGPGESTEIRLTTNVGQHRGLLEHSVVVLFDYDSGTDDASAWTSDSMTLSVRGIVIPDYDCEPVMLEFKSVDPTSTVVRITATEACPELRVETADTNRSAVTVSSVTEVANGIWEIDVEFAGAETSTGFDDRGELRIATNSNRQPTLRVPIRFVQSL